MSGSATDIVRRRECAVLDSLDEHRGYGATIAQLTTYQTCMTRNGWQDQRTLF